MNEIDLHHEIDYILRKFPDNRTIFTVPDELMMHRELGSSDAFYVSDKLEEYGLAERVKHRGDLRLTTFGSGILDNGGWLVYLKDLKEREAAQQHMESESRRAEAEQKRRDSTNARFSTWGGIVSAVCAVITIFLTFRPSSKSDSLNEKLDSLTMKVDSLEAKFAALEFAGQKPVLKSPVIQSKIDTVKPINRRK